ncbi:MAG: FeoB-associated Cys-rich membrane protein [Desulfobacteraceae bacterium]
MQTAIVIGIVALAAFFMIRRFYNSVKKRSSSACGCGCSGCLPDRKQDCTEKENQS